MKRAPDVYHYQRVSSERLKDLLVLFKSAFGATPEISDVARKHSTEFVGCRDIGTVVYAENGSPAAFYGVFPVMARIGGAAVLIAQSGDTMVHKEHERRGLFVESAKRTYELAVGCGIRSVFGFPSATSYPGFVKRLGWKHIRDVQRYRFHAPMLPASEFLWRFPVARKALAAWQSLVLRVFPDGEFFAGCLMGRNADCIERSKGYWEYKLRNPLVRCVRVRGVNVVLKLEGSLGVGDIDSDDPLAISKVLRTLRVFCVISGISRINTYLSDGSPLELALRRISNPAKGLPFGYADFSGGVSVGDLGFCYLDMDTF
jgi:hypothetical protein